jgi:hypothetical protein
MFLYLVAASLGTAQAEPLDPNLACIVDRIPMSARAAVLDEAATGEGSAVRQAFRDATDACGRERNWTPQLASGAGRIAAGLVVGEEAAGLLERNGISPDLIHDWFEAQPASIQQNAENSQDPAALLVGHLQAGGVSPERVEANARTIGLLLGALQMIARIGAGLE